MNRISLILFAATALVSLPSAYFVHVSKRLPPLEVSLQVSPETSPEQLASAERRIKAIVNRPGHELTQARLIEIFERERHFYLAFTALLLAIIGLLGLFVTLKHFYARHEFESMVNRTESLVYSLNDADERAKYLEKEQHKMMATIRLSQITSGFQINRPLMVDGKTFEWSMDGVKSYIETSLGAELERLGPSAGEWAASNVQVIANFAATCLDTAVRQKIAGDGESIDKEWATRPDNTIYALLKETLIYGGVGPATSKSIIQELYSIVNRKLP